MTTPGNPYLGKIAYCLFGDAHDAQHTFDNIQEFYLNIEQTDFYLQSPHEFSLPTTINVEQITCDNLLYQTELWYQKYKTLPVLRNWPLPRGAITHLLSIRQVVALIYQSKCPIDYDLFVLSSWQARYHGEIDLQQHWPLQSMVYSRQMMIYGPSLKWLVTPLVHLNYLSSLIIDLYTWLQTNPVLDFPWGLHQNWPSKWNWSLVIAQYLHSKGVICHHHEWPVRLVHKNHTVY